MKINQIKIFVALFVTVLVTLACGFNLSTAKIDEAYMAFDEAGEQRTTIYSPTDTFYAIVNLKNAPDDTTLKGVFTAVDLISGEKDVNIGEDTVTTGSGQATFNASGNWSAGKYKIDIYLNDELDTTLEFEVKAGEETPTSPVPELPASTPPGTPGLPYAPTPTSAAMPTLPAQPQTGSLVQSAFMAKDEAGQQPTTVFAPSDTFYVIVEMPGAPADTVGKAVWYAVNAEGIAPNSMLDQAEVTGTGTFTFNYSNNNPWPVGRYMVEIYANGQFAQNLEFDVVGDAPANPPPTSSGLIQNAFLSLDSAGQQPSTYFTPNSIVFAIVDMPNAAADTLVEADWYVVEAAGAESNSLIDSAGINGNGRLTFSLEPSNPWPVGTYQVQILVNGSLDQILDFYVQ